MVVQCANLSCLSKAYFIFRMPKGGVMAVRIVLVRERFGWKLKSNLVESYAAHEKGKLFVYGLSLYWIWNSYLWLSVITIKREIVNASSHEDFASNKTMGRANCRETFRP